MQAINQTENISCDEIIHMIYKMWRTIFFFHLYLFFPILWYTQKTFFVRSFELRFMHASLCPTTNSNIARQDSTRLFVYSCVSCNASYDGARFWRKNCTSHKCQKYIEIERDFFFMENDIYALFSCNSFIHFVIRKFYKKSSILILNFTFSRKNLSSEMMKIKFSMIISRILKRFPSISKLSKKKKKQMSNQNSIWEKIAKHFSN